MSSFTALREQGQQGGFCVDLNQFQAGSNEPSPCCHSKIPRLHGKHIDHKQSLGPDSMCWQHCGTLTKNQHRYRKTSSCLRQMMKYEEVQQSRVANR